MGKINILRKLAGISIILTLIFMIIALFQFQSEEESTVLPDQIEYFFNDGWTMATLGVSSQDTSQMQLENPDYIRKLFENAQKQGECQIPELPYEVQSSSECDTITIFQNMLPDDYAGLVMNFTTENAVVHVILDGELIYHSEPSDLEDKERLTGKTENYVDIPNVFADGNLMITLLSVRPDTAVMLQGVSVETRDMVVIGLVGNNIADIGCCLIIIIMAIIMFVLALIRWYTKQPPRGEMYLGMAGMVAGIYCFIGTDTLNIFYNLQEAYEMQEYLVLMLPLFLTLYFERNLHVVYPRRFSTLLCCMSIHGMIQIFFHLFGIRDLHHMVNLSAIAVGVVCVTAIVSLVQYDYSHRSYQTVISVLAMVVLLSGGIANVVINIILQSDHVNTAGQYSMTVFGIIMAAMHVFRLSKEYRADVEKRVRETEQQNICLEQAKQEAEAAKQEALSANKAKGMFLAHMSHEIRTPINAVLGMDEMILRESREQNIKEYAMDIYMAGQTLLSLVNDILDFSKIESGKMEIIPAEYDLSSMIHDLANMASQRASDKNITLKVEVSHDIPSRLYGDDVRIRQILTNILTNAVKYTREGTVWLRLKSREAAEHIILQFEVEDTGIGIKKEDLPKLSAEFERIEEDRNRNIEGTGLGMSITIQLLALLGSKLHVDSVYGKGSKFSFELEQKVIDRTPIGDFEMRVRQIAENYNYSTKFCAPEAKILVVDDNAVNRKVLRNLLKETQIQVTDAGGGRECLQLVQEQHYDLIFLDHMMPEMDGIETLHEIRKLTDFPCLGTPIVVLTANAVSGAKEKYLEEGFDDFLSKPVIPEKLEHMIGKMLPKDLLTDGSQQPKAEETDTFPEQLPQVDGVDWQYAWMHLPDPELLEYTVKEFYVQISSAADKLQQSFEQIENVYQQARVLSEDPEIVKKESVKDAGEYLESYRIQVHAMKSLAATVGILPLSGVAKMLESAARDGDIDVLLSVTGAFLKEWSSYREKLSGVFGIEVEGKKEVMDHSVLKALVEMVRLSMQEMDIDQADKLIGQLREYEYEQEIEQDMRRLEEAVTNLDTEEVEQIAEVILGWQ
ncbi:Sensor histidine kinase RcsC [Eubacterium plexicaudatum ASF492]|uniref:Circadian input-output histidine kinase CikA n=1 Tax=Eubacterium plexicaudatum ASF492 TaxID=1235802 RepID=N2B8C9_9FIRM|nr:Sensor histidine kinase RcsC [Eubacterium plexicaudatum ASF492]